MLRPAPCGVHLGVWDFRSTQHSGGAEQKATSFRPFNINRFTFDNQLIIDLNLVNIHEALSGGSRF